MFLKKTVFLHYHRRKMFFAYFKQNSRLLIINKINYFIKKNFKKIWKFQKSLIKFTAYKNNFGVAFLHTP